MSYFTSFLFEGHPIIICVLQSCEYVSSCMAICMSFVVMHVGMSVVVLRESIFMFTIAISLSLFSVCFCLDSRLLCISQDLVCILYLF